MNKQLADVHPPCQYSDAQSAVEALSQVEMASQTAEDQLNALWGKYRTAEATHAKDLKNLTAFHNRMRCLQFLDGQPPTASAAATAIEVAAAFPGNAAEAGSFSIFSESGRKRRAVGLGPDTMKSF